MIERYTLEKMGSLWAPRKKFETWLKIEIFACEGMEKIGIVPSEDFKKIKKTAKINLQRINELEGIVKHDVIAFVTSVTEKMGKEGRYIHFGLTSSDLLDTGLAVLMKEASDILIRDLEDLRGVFKERAKEFKHTVMIGRSHGIHGEPITFGLKLALWFEETCRNIERLKHAKDEISYGKLSGSMGTFAHLPPFVEEFVCRRCGLKPAPLSNQIVQRDRHALFMNTLALIGSSLEKFSTEIRHLQRTEVGEVEEFFSEGQKGSSSMPHKRNPIGSENISGLARLLRSYSLAALENVPLWHERDISHSSVERVIFPDGTILLNYMIRRMIHLIKNLVVFPEQMARNLDLTGGIIYSQRLLLELARKGMSRDKAYEVVQKCAGHSVRTQKSFEQLIRREPLVKKHLSKRELDDCFLPEYYLKNLDFIYKRVFG